MTLQQQVIAGQVGRQHYERKARAKMTCCGKHLGKLPAICETCKTLHYRDPITGKLAMSVPRLVSAPIPKVQA